MNKMKGGEKIKSSKCMRTNPKKNKVGFTLIELLVVIFILTILSAVIVISVLGVFKPAGESAYTTAKEDIVKAITAYSSNSKAPGAVPTLAGKYSVLGVNYSVVDLSLLLTTGGGIMKTMPTGLYLSGTAGYDNCNGNAGLGCKTKNHYVWLVDSIGNVYSVCIDDTANKGGCATANTSGYQGTWP